MLYLLPFHPPVTAVVAGDDGSVSVRRENVGGLGRWDIFDAAGSPAWSALLPSATWITWIRGRDAVIVERDTFDVEYVKVGRFEAGIQR